jgi:two-component system sensor histidine kinase RegB
MREVFSAVREELQPQVAQRLDTRAPDDLRVVWPVRAVAQAVVNLVRNAAQASSAHELVKVEGRSNGDGRVRIDVIDRGSGMAPDHLARVGEPFFTTKPPGAGTGLGLFVARSTIEQLGGTLGLASEQGRGTTATILLPADVLAPAKSS